MAETKSYSNKINYVHIPRAAGTPLVCLFAPTLTARQRERAAGEVPVSGFPPFFFLLLPISSCSASTTCRLLAPHIPFLTDVTVLGNVDCGGKLAGCYGLASLKDKHSVVMLREPVSRIRSSYVDKQYPSGNPEQKVGPPYYALPSSPPSSQSLTLLNTNRKRPRQRAPSRSTSPFPACLIVRPRSLLGRAARISARLGPRK